MAAASRVRVLAATFVGIALAGAAMHWQGREDTGLREPPGGDAAHVEAMQRARFDTGFRQAVVMLHARQYEHAATALHQLLKIAPEVPEVHVNMGFALLGLGRHAEARDFFAGAAELAPAQPNTYYGLAVSLEALGDTAGALGAMRTFVHLTTPDDPWLPKARAALWEWQAKEAKR
jgi:Flp pilus assembly protein TadD